MCGRFLLDSEVHALIDQHGVFKTVEGLYTGKTEILPSESIWAVFEARGGINQVVKAFEWGLNVTIDGRQKRVINARSETFCQKSLFKNLTPCVIPASGYYEWHRTTKAKYIIRGSMSILNFAGLFDPVRQEVVILTQPAAEEIAFLHDRMPLVLTQSRIHDWLSKRLLPLGCAPDRAEQSATTFFATCLEPFEQLSFFGRPEK